MPIPSLRLARTILAATLAAGLAAADKIYLTDGRVLDEVEVVNETLEGVTYKDKKKSGEQKVAADAVLSVRYTKMPRLVDQAETEAEEGQVESAITDFEQYADGQLGGAERADRQLWAPAYALKRAIDLHTSVGNVAKVVELTDKLISKVPDSRYVPMAFLARIEALREQKKEQAAQEAVTAFRNLIQAKGLSDRWRLEADLLDVLSNPALKGQAKRDRLIEIESQAGEQYPITRNRARVAQGESFLEGDSPEFAKARKIFDGIVADPKADDTTLAAAYTGLGDCLFKETVDKVKAGTDASASARACLLAYMRVIVVYKDQTRYVPKAMYFAGRSFEFLGDDNKLNARKMYSSVIQGFPKSPWATEAKNQRK